MLTNHTRGENKILLNWAFQFCHTPPSSGKGTEMSRDWEGGANGCGGWELKNITTVCLSQKLSVCASKPKKKIMKI